MDGESEKPSGSGSDVRIEKSDTKALSEQLREVWTQYETLHSSLGKSLGGVSGKAILFVSSVKGEGTTTILSEYGASLGTDREKGTLLVDANLRNPGLHTVFGLENEKGFSDVLSGNEDLLSCVYRIGEESLYILPTGNPTSSPGSLITYSRISRFLEDARKEYSLVLIDGPPVITCAEATLIASIVDGVVLIIETERTKREIVGRAKSAMKEAKANIVGVVLNRRRFAIPKFIYRHL